MWGKIKIHGIANEHGTLRSEVVYSGSSSKGATSGESSHDPEKKVIKESKA